MQISSHPGLEMRFWVRKVAHGRFRKASGVEIRGFVKSWFRNAFWGKGNCPWEVPKRRLELKIRISSNPGLENLFFGKGICPWEVPKKRLELKIRISSNPGLENLFFGEEICPRGTSKARLKLKILILWKHGIRTGVV